VANAGPPPKKERTDLISKDIFRSIGAKLKGIINDDIGDDNNY